MLLTRAKAACPICGTAQCACTGENEPHVGRPLDLAAVRERSDGSMSHVQAKEDILIPKPGQVGAYELAYKAGDFIREEDIPGLEALGVNLSGAGSKKKAKAKAEPPQDKAKRGPREGSASRDKAMTEKEE